MAHPYKQHRSPLNSYACLVNPKKCLFKGGIKLWNFVKDQTIPITTRNIKNPSKGQKWKFNPKAVRNYAVGTAIGTSSNYLDNINQVQRDKTVVKQSQNYKTIENLMKPKDIKIDTSGLGYDENFNKIGN
tara:strand:- start:108 stop:497 length:390 start_codon:yes stop_codon:yes gene_type:complete